MEKEISRRNFLKGLVGLVGSAMIPKIAGACPKEDERTFLDVIKPILKNPEIIKQDKDGRIYAKFNVPLNVINDLSLHSEKYDLTSTDGQETFYETLQKALENLEPKNTYVVEFDMRDPFNPGRITNVYTPSGEKLNAFAGYRCVGSPFVFNE